MQVQFPNIHFIATTKTFNPVLSLNPTEYNVYTGLLKTRSFTTIYRQGNAFYQSTLLYSREKRNGTKDATHAGHII
ncbi:hypothetical protein GALMADRAFT_231335 [Galerina marginata CBS 339.88]|uniref:Uncharacterized protein n=1 Tax=Galerina marginata (strain CBS 339.88) TaxID=685588 RepID=A0A067SBX3_GALM3|nr:hypothetical protein GALMADRAFT_231335 [Galerina marginata CBS 339.88]